MATRFLGFHDPGQDVEGAIKQKADLRYQSILSTKPSLRRDFSRNPEGSVRHRDPCLNHAELALEEVIKGVGYDVVGDGPLLKTCRGRPCAPV